MNREIIDTAEPQRTYYLLEEDENYKILVLHVLKKLDNDIKQVILDMLITEEALRLEEQNFEELTQLMNQNWYEIDLNLSDIESDWYYSD